MYFTDHLLFNENEKPEYIKDIYYNNNLFFMEYRKYKPGLGKSPIHPVSLSIVMASVEIFVSWTHNV
jgi:hypothetical protein